MNAEQLRELIEKLTAEQKAIVEEANYLLAKVAGKIELAGQMLSDLAVAEEEPHE